MGDWVAIAGTNHGTIEALLPRSSVFTRLAAGSTRDIQIVAANVDVVPQFQVTLNRRQHVRVNVGLQIPATNSEGRPRQLVCYFLWDWFDGGLLDGWR